MKIIESYKVPEGNVSPDIFKLPCVLWAAKNGKGGILYELNSDERVTKTFPIAHAGDWICKDSKGKWRVLTDDEYRKICKDTPKEYQPIRGC